MKNDPQGTAPSPPSHDSVERRRKLRITEQFLVTVQGVNAGGELLEIDTVIANLSASGLYLKIPAGVVPGAELTFTVRLSHREDCAPQVLFRGVVLRTELHADLRFGIGVAFTSRRFL